MLTAAALALALALAGPPAAAVQDGAAQVRAELQALDAELNRARRARDRAALERIYAPEFRWVHSTGQVDDRERQIAAMLSAAVDRDLPPLDFAAPAELIVEGEIAVLRNPAQTSAAGVRLYTTQVFVRRDGQWRLLQIQGTALQAERRYVALAPAALDAFAGRYRSASGTETVVTRAGDALHAQIPNLPTRVLRPVAPNRFFDANGTEYIYSRPARTDARAASPSSCRPGARGARIAWSEARRCAGCGWRRSGSR